MIADIRIVNPAEGATDFQTVVNAVGSADPHHIPTATPFPARGTTLIAYKDATPIACCCAALQTHNPTLGTIGTFHALNDPTTARTMLDAATDILGKQGAQRILAPMDGDTWHPYRLNTGPYDAPPFIKEPWNPTYYPALLENAGFAMAERYDSYIINAPAQAAANQEKFHQRCLKQGYTFTEITSRNYATLLPLIYQLSCQIFSENILYTPIDQAEFLRMYLPAKSLIAKGLSWLATAPDGAPAGYVFTFPDYADALRAMRGGTNLMAKIRFLRHKSRATRTCIKTLGTTPEKRGSGLTAALTYLSYRGTVQLGYKQALMCLMHSSNDSRRFGGNADHPYRSYALYQRTP
jgi:hypothetical protein